MAIQVLSWNIKSFVACVTYGGNRLTIIERAMEMFDLICVYEVPNTTNGNNCLANFVNGLNNFSGKVYAGIAEPTRGLGKENDQVGIIYNTATVGVANTTANRRPLLTGGRDPVYFDVTEINTGNTCEFCAWHAPQPAQNNLISQGWQNILRNTLDINRNAVTAVVMGDFNAALTVPTKRGPGRQLARQITNGIGTTLRPNQSSQVSILNYRTSNMYDQFYVDGAILGNVGNSGVFDVMNKLATNVAPYQNVYGTSYNSNHKAYQYYYGRISDHLPVAITVTL